MTLASKLAPLFESGNGSSGAGFPRKAHKGSLWFEVVISGWSHHTKKPAIIVVIDWVINGRKKGCILRHI